MTKNQSMKITEEIPATLTEAIRLFASLLDGEREAVLEEMRNRVRRIPA